MRPLIPCLLLALAGCAATPQETARAQAEQAQRADKLATRLAGFTPGQPQDCLTNFPGDRPSETIGSTILYVQSPKLIYRNDTSGGCEGMERGDYIVTVSNGGRLCRGDIGRTFQPTVGNIPTGSCALGAFVPYSKP
jgi:hypothetical protein